MMAMKNVAWTVLSIRRHRRSRSCSVRVAFEGVGMVLLGQGGAQVQRHVGLTLKNRSMSAIVCAITSSSSGCSTSSTSKLPRFLRKVGR